MLVHARTVCIRFFGACALMAPGVAWAADEIQVYNGGIAEVGQFTFQQHLNYTVVGQTRPDFPGALVSNHARRTAH
jgi:hypothetical protein